MSLDAATSPVPRSKEEAMYQAVVTTKPIVFLPAAGTMRVALEG